MTVELAFEYAVKGTVGVCVIVLALTVTVVAVAHMVAFTRDTFWGRE